MKPKTPLCELPPEKLPEFWGDSARINALYAPFRERSANSRDWDSKLFFWKGITEVWCDFNKICTFSESELKQYFIQNGRTPACLSTVVGEMFKNGDIITLEKFLEPPQKTWTGWAFNLAKKPLSWGFSKVKNTVSPPTNVENTFVHVQSVKKQSENIFNSVPKEKCNKVMTINELINICELQDYNLDTLKMLLHYLKVQNKIDSIEYVNKDHDKTVLMVKFASKNGKLEPISSVDMGKFTLQENENLLIQKIEDLEKEKNLALETTKAYLRKGLKNMAKTSLRKEKELGRRIDKQLSVLENVQTLLGRLDTAEHDGKVLESYKSGLNALKDVFKDTGLTEDGVADTMTDLEEVLETHDDIQTSLSQNLTSTLDAELEQELADLLAEPENNDTNTGTGGISDEDLSTLDKIKTPEEDELTRRLRALKMPIVPNESPSSSPEKPVQLS